jgi:hypothetical protein
LPANIPVILWYETKVAVVPLPLFNSGRHTSGIRPSDLPAYNLLYYSFILVDLRKKKKKERKTWTP